MQTHVYANGREVASKAADGKASAAFPDPCWSPPAPGAGPVLLPYPNTVFARDITNGTATVKVCGTEVALEDHSFFSTSTGNEPATQAFKKGVKTSVIKGKAYFQSWSFDVAFEGKGVARHQDLTTHNHGSKPGDTPPTYYIDDPDARAKCKDELSAINKKCKPEPPQSEEDEKKGKPRKRKKGLSGALGKAAEALDSAGKRASGYSRNKLGKTATDGNAWMEDHCTGLWISPQHESPAALQQQLQSMVDNIESSRLSLMGKAFGELKDIAIEKAGEAAASKAAWFTARTALKSVVGAAGVETAVVPVVMGAWTAADLISTATELAAMAGPAGQAALNAILDIKNVKENAKAVLVDFQNNPHKVHANIMSMMAQLDPCVRARKCMLVPYKNTQSIDDKAAREIRDSDEGGGGLKAIAQARHGNGCCPGQTGHHILPDAMVASANCPGYDYDSAPTICMEGTNNHAAHGSHGMAHGKLKTSMDEYRRQHNKNSMPYAEAKKKGLDAIEAAGAAHCDRKCLEAQLDKHYKGCVGKELAAHSGSGGGEFQGTSKKGVKK